MNKLKDLSKHIFNSAVNNLSTDEIANSLNITNSDLDKLFNKYEELKTAYDKGLIQSKIEYKTTIKNQVSKGKIQALALYENIIKQNKPIEPVIVETKEQKYIRMRAIKLMHYFSNISPEVLDYIKEKTGYCEDLEKINWAYKNNKLP